MKSGLFTLGVMLTALASGCFDPARPADFEQSVLQPLPVTIEDMSRIDVYQSDAGGDEDSPAVFDAIDVFQAGGFLALRHTGAAFDCAASVKMYMETSGSAVRIHEVQEFEGAASGQTCMFDLQAELPAGLEGTLRLEVIDDRQVLRFSADMPVPADPRSCLKAGGKFMDFDTEGKCCSPTVPMTFKKPTDGKCVGLKCPCFICLNCGDGICDKYEDFCNCPADCGKTCKKSGKFEKWGGDIDSMCCKGYKSIKYATYSNGKCAWPKSPVFVCAKCGNGTCDKGENPCNCEQDCPKTKKCGPFPGGTCGSGEVCNIGSCLLGASGTCVKKPGACTMQYDPVCGCDGKTYGNDCTRLQAGVPLDHKGACGSGKKCGPFPGGSCGSGEVCNIESCALGASGQCATKPEKCETFMYQPVCGCDGKTYPDNCDRIKAGVPLNHKGEC